MKGTIKSKEKISWLFVNGNKFTGAGFLALSSAQTEDNEEPDNNGRTAFIAGKKLGTAPVRNRAKRRLREAAREAGAPWDGYDVVFVARHGVLKADFAEVTHDIRRLGNHLNSNKRSQDPDIKHLPYKEENEMICPPADKQKKTPLSLIVGTPRNIALSCINIYRHAISPLFPPSCRYIPTCSEYALIAFKRFGFWRGLWLSLKRLGRCHPLAEGGYDPVPEVLSNKLA